MSKERILVVEDQADISGLLKIYFTSQGYEVMTAMRGQIALELARKTPPNLALLDVNLPDMEGYDIGKALRANARTKHIPIIFLTARGEKQDKLKGLGDVQADDYIVKPFDIEEVHMRVRRNLDRAREKNRTHPVTGMPTAELINEELRRVLQATDEWSLAMVHINGFDTFTQVYGSVVGEDVLKFGAILINEVINEVGGAEDFVGQLVTGPDFLITSSTERIRAIVERIMERFDQEIGLHYSYPDRKRGHILVKQPDGSEVQASLMSLSVGVLHSADGPFYDIRELSETAEGVRYQAQAPADGAKSVAKFGR
ncbi:MAG TPA: response regulator [Herpetosiphonaceae bacterium]